MLADAKTGRLLECNDPACQAICCTRQEFGEHKLADLLGDESCEQVARHIEEVLKQGSGVFETQYRSKGGEIRAVQASYRVLSVSGGDVIYAVFSDITESKQAQDRLQLLSSAVEQVAEGITLARLDGTLVYVNRAFAAMHGYSPEEVVGKHLSIFHTPEQMPSVEAISRQTREAGCFDGEVWHARRDGSVFPTLMSISYLRDEEGNVVGGIGTVRDITEWKQAEERLRLLSSGVAQVSEGIALADLDGTLVFVNRAFAAMHGYSPEELLGKHFSIFHSPEQMPCMEAIDRQLSETGDFSGEIWHARRDGSVFPGRMCVSLFRDEAGNIAGRIGTLRDITEQKRAEEALQTAHNELEAQVQQRTTALVEVNQQLKREIDRRKLADEQLHLLHTQLAHMGRVGTMGEMASGLAHELNQPLCAVTAYAQACSRLLNSKADPAELQEPLREVANEAKRAGEIIRRLRNFVRRAGPRRSSADVNQLIPEVAQLLTHEVRSHEISMHFDLADDLPLVLIDAIQIQQVILNLMRNSIQVLADEDLQDREIKISTTATDDGTVLVTIQDSGPRISPEIADQIFEPFFSTRSDGLGMGLALSRSIIEEHGGCMWFARCPERGSVFQFTLPVHDGERGHDA